jgi:hypothetical protein
MCGAAGTRYPVSNSDPGAMGESTFIAHNNSKYESDRADINWLINVKWRPAVEKNYEAFFCSPEEAFF